MQIIEAPAVIEGKSFKRNYIVIFSLALCFLNSIAEVGGR